MAWYEHVLGVLAMIACFGLLFFGVGRWIVWAVCVPTSRQARDKRRVTCPR